MLFIGVFIIMVVICTVGVVGCVPMRCIVVVGIGCVVRVIVEGVWRAA